MLKLNFKERGTVPRKMIPRHNDAKRIAFREIAEYYHTRFTPKRFTRAHGRAAGYSARSGENLPYGSKAYWRSYTGRKHRQIGEISPFVWSGTTRRASRSVNIVVTTKGARLRYRMNALNFHPKLLLEFLKMLPEESQRLSDLWDKAYNRELKRRKPRE